MVMLVKWDEKQYSRSLGKLHHIVVNFMALKINADVDKCESYSDDKDTIKAKAKGSATLQITRDIMGLVWEK